jgi:hypothetical protein
MYIGFEKFTAGQVRVEFLEAYEYRKREAKGQPNWNKMMEILVERERRLGMPTHDLRFSEKGKPTEGASAYNIKNYNVCTKSVSKPVSNYRPTTTYVDRTEQYSDFSSDNTAYNLKHPAPLQKVEGNTKRKPSEGAEVEAAFESAAEDDEEEEDESDNEERQPIRRSARKT